VRISLPGGEQLLVPVHAEGITVGVPLTLGLRPEHLSELGHGEARILAKTLVVEHLGGETFSHAQTADGHHIMVKGAGHSQVKSGQNLVIGVTGAGCHLFDEQGCALVHLTHYSDVEHPTFPEGDLAIEQQISSL
jgi:multiple sugar transport system ATP-binding protein